ncbi:hypothetical protein BCR36DRAFT_414697 [Piromyces finnis]|uniref:VWFA domain-containing protein n=1 Tax=Piromyces finnis TaxID=1754191 RepID=A0A1Y1V3T4_9FUNG|nr:hypothetical protein BCR36DRAFT_414697 [Piromyces finnis]|eukprot:ORX45237.1 hypothetical protein BCR36DRAFT_414697 [Piromyces finnis]
MSTEIENENENIKIEETEMDIKDIPNEFLCPLTSKIMRTPVLMPDGFIYEEEAITKILKENSISPVSKIKINIEDAIPSISLEEKISKYIEEKNIELNNENLKNIIKNLNFENVVNEEVQLQNQVVEFDKLTATYISKEKSNNLCENCIHVCMKPKKVVKTLPILLIFVVDVSGSMQINCCSNIESLESVYISRLSLIKHSIKTIVSSLRSNDMVSLIEFSNNATVKLKPTILRSKVVKDMVIEIVDSMYSQNCTNIWSGMEAAIDISKGISYKNYQKSIMVFTDGESNMDPPKGIYETLKDTLNETDDKFTISTFSYGNDAKSKLLIDIANLCDGIYGYCPDGSMVGTIFINYMANLLSTITPITKVSMLNKKKDDENKKVSIGPLYREKYQNVIFDINKESSLDDITIKVELPMTNQTFEVSLNTESPDINKFINEMESSDKELKNENENDDNDNDDDDDDDDDELLDDEDDDDENTLLKIEDADPNILIEEKDIESIHYEEIVYNEILRKKFISIIKNILKNTDLKESNKIVDEFFNMLKQLKYKTKFVKGLIIDIDNPDPNHGQVKKAIQTQYYNRWGEFYLWSFIRFHEFEQCGNFKDQSLQYYSHNIFNSYRKIANSLFINLPPPAASTSIGRYTFTKSSSSSSFTKSSSSSFLSKKSIFSSITRLFSRNKKRNKERTVKEGTVNLDSSSSQPFMCDTDDVLLTRPTNKNNTDYSIFTAPTSISEDFNSPTTLNSNTMSAFLNRKGGCFNGDAIVVLSNGQIKHVKDLKKGDRLNNNAIVQCLIEQVIDTSSSQPFMCDVDGVLLTPYHPINKNNTWYFPIDLYQAKLTPIKSWFNLILKDDAHQKYEVEFQNGIKAITLGHYRTENNILKHPYFGTDAVLKDLKELDPSGFKNGYIYLSSFNPRQIKYDENHYCINYYSATIISSTKTEMFLQDSEDIFYINN